MFISIVQEMIKLVDGVVVMVVGEVGGTGDAVGRLAHTLPSAASSLRRTAKTGSY